jgi:hypothetical protein
VEGNRGRLSSTANRARARLRRNCGWNASRVGGEGGDFLFCKFPWPTQSPISKVLRALSSTVNWPGLETNHSPRSIAEVKNSLGGHTYQHSHIHLRFSQI